MWSKQEEKHQLSTSSITDDAYANNENDYAESKFKKIPNNMPRPKSGGCPKRLEKELAQSQLKTKRERHEIYEGNIS